MTRIKKKRLHDTTISLKKRAVIKLGDGLRTEMNIANATLKTYKASPPYIKLNIVYSSFSDTRVQCREEILSLKEDITNIMKKHGFNIPFERKILLDEQKEAMSKNKEQELEPLLRFDDAAKVNVVKEKSVLKYHEVE